MAEAGCVHGVRAQPLLKMVIMKTGKDDSSWDAAERTDVRGKLLVITDYVQSIREGRP
jgi:hypothetical protein